MNNTRKIIAVGWCAAVIEILIVINSYFFNLIGATADAEQFVASAKIWTIVGSLEFATNAEFFTQFLGVIFLVFGPSEFIASQFGLAAMIVAAVYLMKIYESLKINMPIWVILIFFLWPSTAFRISTTLREPYLIMFMIMMCYYVLAYARTRNLSYVTKLFFVSIFAFIFHKAFAIFFVFSMGFILFGVMRVRGDWFKSPVVLMRVLLLSSVSAVLFYILYFNADVNGVKPLIAVLTADTDYISGIRAYQAERGFRATYSAKLDFTSLFAFVQSLIPVIGYYMFAPFPWQIETAGDMLTSFEGVVRGLALMQFVRIGFLAKSRPVGVAPMMLLVLLLCLIWAAGTSNYGTASRHHVTTNWAFVLVLVMAFSKRSALSSEAVPLMERQAQSLAAQR